MDITAALFLKCLCFSASPSSTWWSKRNLSCCRGRCISGIPRPTFSVQRLAQGNTFYLDHQIRKFTNLHEVNFPPRIKHQSSDKFIYPQCSPKFLCLQVQSSLQADQTPRAWREVAEGEDDLWMDHDVPRKWGINYRKPWEKGDLTLGK